MYTNPYIQSARQQDPRLAYAQRLMAQGSSGAPVQSPLEGVLRALQAPVGGFFQSRVDKEYRQKDDAYRQALAQALQGDDPLGALSQSTDPQLMGMALEGRLQQQLKGPGETFAPLTDDEERALGLNPAGTYQRGTSGKIDILMQPEGPQKPTGTMQEYELAKSQGFQGSILDYQEYLKKAGRPVTNVNTITNTGPTGINYGDPGPGLVWQRTPDGEIALDDRGAPVAIPFQGGPAWVKQQEGEAEALAGAEKAALSEATKQQAADIVLEDIGRAINKVAENPNLTTGIGAQITGGIGGTPAKDVGELVKTIKANIGFDRLQRMRQESPTGGALGQIAVQEIEYLQSVLGSLEQSQSPQQALENLARLEETYMDIVHGKGNRPEGYQPRDVGALLGGGGDPNAALRKKYGLE